MNIKLYLEKTHKSASELADYLGVSRRTVEGWCSGRPVPAWVDKFLSVESIPLDLLVKKTRSKILDLLNYKNLYEEDYSRARTVYLLWLSLYPSDHVDFNSINEEFLSLCKFDA